MNRVQRDKALLPVRLAIKGWAFMDESRWPDVVRRAEAVRDELPVGLRAAADDIIRDVKDRLA